MAPSEQLFERALDIYRATWYNTEEIEQMFYSLLKNRPTDPEKVNSYQRVICCRFPQLNGGDELQTELEVYNAVIDTGMADVSSIEDAELLFALIKEDLKILRSDNQS